MNVCLQDKLLPVILLHQLMSTPFPNFKKEKFYQSISFREKIISLNLIFLIKAVFLSLFFRRFFPE
ncbi:Uncharacterized protein APZ42_012766 [Daphnia magna]|uniref:Uncharacterized protein n=1 Tax=Daphnia magna TaxID=35525 RepID=A0A162RHU4_9CRUS|nr:Uncharacterized protein APZ42_012766 [Daphnia magna]